MDCYGSPSLGDSIRRRIESVHILFSPLTESILVSFNCVYPGLSFFFSLFETFFFFQLSIDSHV